MQEFREFEENLECAIGAISALRESAETIKERIDAIIDSCETIEREI